MLPLVIPGQVIASSPLTSSSNNNNNENDSNESTTDFLRGHGTYVERTNNEDRLIASVCGIVQRVNKLITVIPFSTSIYQGQVGDLVIGRITKVGTTRWHVSLASCTISASNSNNNTTYQREALLPLSGVHLPGGIQRVRTIQDQRDMRNYLQEGDLISAEIHKVQTKDNTYLLHTRSYRYSKLENGCIISVPPSLILRRKNHFLEGYLNGIVDVIWGINGNIWIQRTLQKQKKQNQQQNQQQDTNNSNMVDTTKDLAELQESLRKQHAITPIEYDERQVISRLRNSIECLKLVHCMVTPENSELIYNTSIQLQLKPNEMLYPDNVIKLTETCRK